MTERDLQDLKNFPIPPASAEAKRAARAAALAAFDLAQGKSGEIRPTPASHGAMRSKPMVVTRTQYALAASIAALMIAAPLAFQLNQKGPDLPTGGDTPIDSTALSRQEIIDATKPAPKSMTAESRRKNDGAFLVDKMAPTPGRHAPDIGKIVAGAGANQPGIVAPAKPAEGLLEAVPEMKVELDLLAANGQTRTASADADRRQILEEKEYRDTFEATKTNPVKQVTMEPVSTFSIDVDTASYSFVRRALNSGHLPPKDSVRVEEMINYFPYDYPAPASVEKPFQPTVTVMPSPWNPANELVHVAIKGYDLKSAERPRANLVFLIDVSGSMEPADRLPLVKNAFRMLVDELKPSDTVSIVTYASGSGVLLEPTHISDKGKIIAAIDRLGAGGSTAGAEGIHDAYRLAEANFDTSAVNRVILATDGDFNVGVTDPDDLKGLIERKREKGIFLSILGVGQGNYNDALMQTLAQNGNGTAAYADTLNEARKVLVDEASSTLFTIAKDVKVQIEWNPARVSEYRLIGYETRALAREDFNNDKVDAGDIGSGHTVTAIYEVTPAGSEGTLAGNLRYATPEAARRETGPADRSAEIGFLKLRYKLPTARQSQLIEQPILARDAGEAAEPNTTASQEARFSVAVAAFGQLLKGSPFLNNFGYDDVIGLAQSARGNDPYGYRAEFVNIVRLAKSAQP